MNDESEQVYEKVFDTEISDILLQVLAGVMGNQWIKDGNGEDMFKYFKRTVKASFNSCISSGAFGPFKFEDIALVFEKLTGEPGDTYEDEWNADFQSAIEQNKQFFGQ